MNVGLLFAGGVGMRMNAKSKPKQFLELHGKPVIVYTMEVFENHPEIDEIVVACVETYIDELKNYIRKFGIRKVSAIVPGGSSAFHSVFNGLVTLASKCGEDDIVLIHDGVRPLLDEQLISSNILCAKEHGNAISTVAVTEGIIISQDGFLVDDFPDRKLMYATKAPQTFHFSTIYRLYQRARSDGFTPIESAHLCRHYGIQMHMVTSSYGNIKITTPTDYYIFRAIREAIENSQIAGY